MPYKKTIIVVGAGMVGVCTAIHLRLRGHEVVLIDKREPGRETSYGNAGVIQCEAVMPAAMPRSFKALWRILWQQDPSVRFHLRALPSVLPQLAQYWYHSEPKRHQLLSRAYNQLIKHALAEHHALIEAAKAQDLIEKKGYLWVFRTQACMDLEVRKAELLKEEYGVPHTVYDAGALRQHEPGVHDVVGAVHWTAPWACSEPGELVARYAQYFTQLGGSIVQDECQDLIPGWRVVCKQQTYTAEAVVLALGPWSGEWCQRLAYRLPFFLKRGYHQHYTGGAALTRPVLDAERGYVLAPMRRGIRLTTGAELAMRDAEATPLQLQLSSASAAEIMRLGQALAEPPWLGARPCSADMLPIISNAPNHPGLWFNFAHAHQGFTLGPVSGRLLAEMMSAETCMLNPEPYRVTRFARQCS
jgi:D-amino-acid dehydrogenase